MPEIARDKGQYWQVGVPAQVPVISGSTLSVDGFVEFDAELLVDEYPTLHAVIGDTYNDSTPAGSFRTPKTDDWDLADAPNGGYVWMIRF